MFWADKLAQELKKRNLPLEWVDDMKTPSGRIHVGALRGVVVHDLVFKALKDSGIKVKYTYVFENHDPMDSLPVYLPKEKFEKYLGMPLYKIPSPEKGFDNFAQFYAQEFQKVFNAINCFPEILWTKDLYTSGKMNDDITLCLDNAGEIRKIYEEMYKKELPNNWYPFQKYCDNCGKVSTTRVTDWDGSKVLYTCATDAVEWTKGCGYMGKASPFSPNEKGDMSGKLPWKVEWPVKWKVIGVTVEGAGKDHMSRGGSHDLAKLVCERVLKYPVPYPVAYEWFLIGGRKMSTSKGVGSSASEMLEILPPEILRFLMVKTKIEQQINFDPAETETIPKLFDEYQKAAEAYYSSSESAAGDESRRPRIDGSRQARTISSKDPYHSNNDDLARIFELSQINTIQKPPSVRFSVLAQWVQMPNMQQKIRQEGLEEWAKYAKVWVEKYAPESERFTVQEQLPENAKHLSNLQKKFLENVSLELEKEWIPDEFQKQLYTTAKELGLSSKEAFSAIYLALIGKDHGPKAGWLLLSLDRELVKKRIEEVSKMSSWSESVARTIGSDSARKKDAIASLQHDKVSPEVFSIDKQLAEKFPSISIGIAIIKGVEIHKSNPELEKEKQKLISLFKDLTTEQIGQYPEIMSYRKLYKATGIDWHSRRPSPEALLRRVALKKGLYTINTCVDAYNLVVMKQRVSIGAFDLDKIQFPTILRFAKSGEKIHLLGDEEDTVYKEGEVAYFDKSGGFNIDFNYRDAKRSAVQVETKNLYINVDGIFDITSQKVEEVLREACDLIVKYCGGSLEAFGVETAL